MLRNSSRALRVGLLVGAAWLVAGGQSLAQTPGPPPSGGSGCSGSFCAASAPLAANLGGNGLDNSGATGFPLWTAGSQTIVSFSGTGSVVRGTAPTISAPTLSGSVTLSGITGSTQCLHVNTSGVISGTGSDCGAGGGLTVGTTTIASGTSGRVEYNNAGVLGELTPSGLLDLIGSTQGNILYRNGSVWTVLAPGTSGQLLQSGGAAANPSWITASGTGNALFGTTSGNVVGNAVVMSDTGTGIADAGFAPAQPSSLHTEASSWTETAARWKNQDPEQVTATATETFPAVSTLNANGVQLLQNASQSAVVTITPNSADQVCVTGSACAAANTPVALSAGFGAWITVATGKIYATPIPYSSTSGGITSLTGDATASGPGAAALTLATVNSNIGTFGDTTHCASVTVNGKGLITAASQSTSCPAGAGGTFNYSDNGVTVTAGTYYAPIGGGGIPQTTEANVSVKAPSATTVSNLQVSLSADPGSGQTLAVTLRKGGSDQSVTCTITGTGGGAATTCQDLTHSFNIVQNDVIDWKIVTTGTYVATPTITITAANGTSGVGVTTLTAGTNVTFSSGASCTSSCTINASGGAGAVTLVSTLTASSSASLAWTGLTLGTYRVTCAAILPATAGDVLFIQFGQGGGPTWKTTGYQWGGAYTGFASGSVLGNSSTSDVGVAFIASGSGNSGTGVTGEADFFGLASAVTHQGIVHSIFTLNGGSQYNYSGSGFYGTDTTAITAFRVIASTGSLASGSCSLYAISN